MIRPSAMLCIVWLTIAAAAYAQAPNALTPEAGAAGWKLLFDVPPPPPPAQATALGPAEILPGKVFHSSQIPYKGDATKKGRRFFYGAEHTGFNLECHETVLGPGVETHPPHSHAHEEIIIVVEGTVEVSIDGKTETVEAGSVIHYEPDKPHNLRNAGTVPCRYYVIELRGRNQ